MGSFQAPVSALAVCEIHVFSLLFTMWFELPCRQHYTSSIALAGILLALHLV